MSYLKRHGTGRVPQWAPIADTGQVPSCRGWLARARTCSSSPRSWSSSGGWGRSLRRAVGGWYADRSVDGLAYQAVKYRQREGLSHRDLLRLAQRPEGPRPPAHRLRSSAEEHRASNPGEEVRFLSGALDTVAEWTGTRLQSASTAVVRPVS